MCRHPSHQCKIFCFILHLMSRLTVNFTALFNHKWIQTTEIHQFTIKHGINRQFINQMCVNRLYAVYGSQALQCGTRWVTINLNKEFQAELIKPTFLWYWLSWRLGFNLDRKFVFRFFYVWFGVLIAWLSIILSSGLCCHTVWYMLRRHFGGLSCFHLQGPRVTARTAQTYQYLPWAKS